MTDYVYNALQTGLNADRTSTSDSSGYLIGATHFQLVGAVHVGRQ